MLKNNLIALVVTLAIALLWLRINDYFAHKGWISGALSRKIIHIGTGPIFVLCWLFFNDSTAAPFYAAIVPLGITLQFALVGLGVMRDPSTVESLSRSGDRREILRGPLFYGIVFVVLTLLFWRHSPTGMVALMILCGGDGLADVIGKRIKSTKLPWSKNKTLLGSVAMFLGGFFFAAFVVWVFVSRGYFPLPFSSYVLPIAIISIVTTFVESLPFKDIDNLTVPLVAVLLGMWLF
jgi:phytol kinase